MGERLDQLARLHKLHKAGALSARACKGALIGIVVAVGVAGCGGGSTVTTTLASIATLVLVPSQAIATPSVLPRLLTENTSTSFAVRPPTITPSDDGSSIVAGSAAWIGRDPNPQGAFAQFGHIDWTGWTTSQATGTGVLWVDNGTPSEADGTFYPTTVKILASRVRNGVYTRLVLIEHQITRRLALIHDGSWLSWG
jgi:hypothetical protein